MTPLEQLRSGRMPRRLTQLLVGLALYGASMAMVLRGALGQIPWDVLHVGLSRHLPLTFGQIVIVVSLVVLVAWIPLRQHPGLGTIANAILIGFAADAVLEVLSTPDSMALRALLVAGGIVLNGLATALYIGSQLGPGPRDGLMTGLARVTGRSLRLVRTGLEVAVVIAGMLLGGSLGLATVAYALLIGPLAQAMLRWCIVEVDQSSRGVAAEPE